ncbi:efflux RND transporter periplasmic adaptor subunit [Cytophagaceae bacterium YF14B1]|uniref:Efflux RND transporter periplasmic adaptor subunit n=1 Tax=Xanthocytophaga flava TaxID=3048013 RepID=A0AAE3QKL2_9BACT|nr:efflux RND transporter periplasmic adaptor subunit [Xanthocytophaga flavus]MDJ1481092.1 efflux RND transporter periplasmic adaptor subunit [Xanthocytophaga flavus]
MSMAVMLLATACSTNTKQETKEKFLVVSPVIADTVYQKEYVAEINARQNVEVRTRIKGFIEAIAIDEGQAVRQGQTLFTISSKEYHQNLFKAEATLKNALADLKSAEIELENTKRLVSKNIVSTTELEMSNAKVEAMKAQVAEAESDKAQAELNLSFTQIKAPFDGVINRIPNKAGSLVDEGTLLTTLSNNKEVFAYFNVSERDYLDYITSKQDEEKQAVSLILANNTPYIYPGVIETTESEFDRHTGNIAFRAKFANPEQILKHGSSGKVLVKTPVKNAMLIPHKSTFEIQENIYVFVVDKDHKVQQRKVVPAIRLPHVYIISEGLAADEKIIYEGIQRVKEGDKIVPETVGFSTLTKL